MLKLDTRNAQPGRMGVFPMSRPKDVLTTGEVARICNVAPRTVSKWFDTGKLKGYRIPGSKDRRIPMQQLIRFMRAHGMPLEGLEAGLTRVVIVESDEVLARTLSVKLAEQAGYDVHLAASAFEAGVAAEQHKPQVMLVDVRLPGMSGREFVRSLHHSEELNGCKVIAVTEHADNGAREALRQEGFDGVLSRPYDTAAVKQTIDEVLAH